MLSKLLYSAITQSRSYQQLLGYLKEDISSVSVFGVPEGLKSFLTSALSEDIGNLLVLTQNDAQAARVYDDLTSLIGKDETYLYPAKTLTLYRSMAESRETSCRRLETLLALRQGRVRILVSPIEAVLSPLMPVALFDEYTIHLQSATGIKPEVLIQKLIYAGYEQTEKVMVKGEFAHRGGILDIYPANMVSPVRIEFFDDEIDTLRSFDPLTQRSTGSLSQVTICPAREAILTKENAKEAFVRLEKELIDKTGGTSSQSREEWLKEEKVLDTYFPLEEEEFGEEDWNEELPNLDKLSSVWEKEEIGQPLQSNEDKEEYAYLYSILDHFRSCEPFSSIENFLPYIYETPESLLSYFPNAFTLFDEPNNLKEHCDNVLLEFSDQLTSAIEQKQALPGQAALLYSYAQIAQTYAQNAIALQLLPISSSSFKAKALVTFSSISGTVFHGNMKSMQEELLSYKKQAYTILVLAGGIARGTRLAQTLRDLGVEAVYLEGNNRSAQPGEVVVLPNSISYGFILPDEKIYVLSDGSVYSPSTKRPSRRRRQTTGEKIGAFTDLTTGDYVVHESHGVGVYKGIQRIETDGKFRDYLTIQYQGSDVLYVPTEQLDCVQRFIGSDGTAPHLNKLGGNEWNKQKAKVKASIKQLAINLVKLYAQRQDTHGYAFSKDSAWQREFEDDFPYEETDDQLQCVEEIKSDMEKPIIMDRLLCGDVGYGKTEVALRAAFKAVMDNKQVAILVPTTILAQQHLSTIQNRMNHFPVNVEMLSRFRTPQEQKKILQNLAQGKVDILVGTHRLLGKDVHFKDLGLLIIDEEQRFGVAHKEKLKDLRKNVDVLTLSATPIPRTLNMSMMGIRDMSLIETPPEARYPVQTYVLEYQDSLLREAILREINRNGQTYILYNRVSSIERFHAHLQQVVPEARIAVGHGQMRESALEDVMIDFYEHKFDVLLCSTIIESGLDVPSANTMIICDADRFGLSQLYQLRGRVGRSNRLAYCYLTVRPNKVISETAQKRLNAVREFTQFGSGFRIAMRDLEIRGAGNLLGAEQSGHLSAIGYDMYCKLMTETINELRGIHVQAPIETHVDLKLNAYIPYDFIPSDKTRMETYKQIASIENKADYDDMMEALIDRFGDIPECVDQLLKIALLKSSAALLQIDRIRQASAGKIVLRFSEQAKLDPQKILTGIQAAQKEISIQNTVPPSLFYFTKEEDMEKVLTPLTQCLQKILTAMQEPLSAKKKTPSKPRR